MRIGHFGGGRGDGEGIRHAVSTPPGGRRQRGGSVRRTQLLHVGGVSWLGSAHLVSCGVGKEGIIAPLRRGS